MKKHYFEIGKVKSITLTMERDADWKWKESIPARPRKFLGIIIGTVNEVPAGWSEYDQEDTYDLPRRIQSSYFEKYGQYRVDEVDKKVFVKPHVTVDVGSGEGIRTRFESDTEAQAWVDDLLASSDKKFHVIINR